MSCLLYKVQIYFSVISLVSCPTVTRTMRKFEGTSSGKNYSKIPTIVSTRYQKLSKSFIKLRNFRLWSLVLFCIYNQQLSVITFFKSVSRAIGLETMWIILDYWKYHDTRFYMKFSMRYPVVFKWSTKSTKKLN